MSLYTLLQLFSLSEQLEPCVMIIFYPKVYYQRQARDVVCRNIRRSEWFRAKQIYETTNRLSDKSLCGTGTC